MRWLQVLVVAVASGLSITLSAQSPSSPVIRLEPRTISTDDAATTDRFVRLSVACPKGFWRKGQSLLARVGDRSLLTQVRELTYHPDSAQEPGLPPQQDWVRRGLVTVLVPNADLKEEIILTLASESSHPALPCTVSPEGVAHVLMGQSSARLTHSPMAIDIAHHGQSFRLVPQVPDPSAEWLETQIVEAGPCLVWLRASFKSEGVNYVLDVRIDSLGGIAASIQLQSKAPSDRYAPIFGWTVTGQVPFAASSSDVEFTTGDGEWRIQLPTHSGYRRGQARVQTDGAFEYLRVGPADHDVPWQPWSWRTAEITLAPSKHGRWNRLLEHICSYRQVDPPVASAYQGQTAMGNVDAIAPTGQAIPGFLSALHQYTQQAIQRSAAIGDDMGNVTSFSDGRDHGGVFGMNRLNHCPAIFQWSRIHSVTSLRETALLWCVNMHDLSIWWGHDQHHGGTRYNNSIAAGKTEHRDDDQFMWRTNDASTFCTKGFDAFYLAYEETGDPRFLHSLNSQIKYARQHIHANTGEARNIGDVKDFMALFRLTGERMYVDEARRLFDQLRSVLTSELLFSQNCKPIEAQPIFIDDDTLGLQHPFAKPYIIGYALNGLPELLREYPDEPQLAECIRAIGDFLASAADPLGGWRYPHPRSSHLILDQSMEHAAQLSRAASVLIDHGEDVSIWIDAIERSLQARFQVFDRTGKILHGLSGWEKSKPEYLAGRSIYDLYKRPEDRAFDRDYREGNIALGGSSPEGLVYFDEVLRFYLSQRDASRLTITSPELQTILQRLPAKDDRR